MQFFFSNINSINKQLEHFATKVKIAIDIGTGYRIFLNFNLFSCIDFLYLYKITMKSMIYV